MTNTEETGWFVAGVATVIGTLASAVAFLFKLNESKNAAAILALAKQVELNQKQIELGDRRHDECQEDRHRLATQIEVIREHVKVLESAQPKLDGSRLV